MADNEPRITNSQKEKDPRKVLAGKKLGAISKMAKAAKQVSEDNQKIQSSQGKSSSTFYASLAAVAVVGCLGVIYITKRPTPNPPGSQELASSSIGTESEAKSTPKFQSNLLSFDD